MNAELREIEDFIQTIPPFEQLKQTSRQALAKQMRISYYRSGTALPGKQDDLAMIYLVRKGVLAYYNLAGELLGKFSEGDVCSLFCRESNDVELLVEEDSLVYAISCAALQATLSDYPNALAFLIQTPEQRLEQKMDRLNDADLVASSLSHASVADYYNTPAITISAQATIQQAALLMTERGVSCLVITAVNQPIGIVTDKDIRRRCVADGLSSQLMVSEIMTANMATIDINNCSYDALVLMISRHIHHLPVTRQGQLVGMITATDLMNQEGRNAVNLSSAIHKANTVEELVELSHMLPTLQLSMAKLGGSADHVGRSISALTMAFTIRLLELAEQKLGPAPVAYAWLSAGSQARREQLVHSDQDNALIIADQALPEHDAWFESLAHFVCDGLAACGYTYCPGNVMATNKQWRQKQAVWQGYFDRWITQPEPQALLNSCVFFDLNTVHGDPQLLQQVRANMLRQTQQNTLFLAHLSRNALLHKPPLGFFRDFVLVQDGNKKKGLDLKHNGLLPIVNLARIYALAEGIAEVNTTERLKQAAGTASLSKAAAANLIHAFEFLGMLRLEHQAKQLSCQQVPDSYLLPKDISKLEREHLKDAFKVIKELQNYRQMV
jgi:CBS domain-containing protein